MADPQSGRKYPLAMVMVSAPISRSPSTMAWPAITNSAPALTEMSAQMRSMSLGLVPVQCTQLVPTWPITWQCDVISEW